MAHIRRECNSFVGAFRITADPARYRRLAAILCFQPVTRGHDMVLCHPNCADGQRKHRGWERTSATLWFRLRPLYASSDSSPLRSARVIRRRRLISASELRSWCFCHKAGYFERLGYPSCLSRERTAGIGIINPAIKRFEQPGGYGLPRRCSFSFALP